MHLHIFRLFRFFGVQNSLCGACFDHKFSQFDRMRGDKNQIFCTLVDKSGEVALTIGGLSGIFKGHDYLKGRFERTPYDKSSMRSVYHVRNIDEFRLKSMPPGNYFYYIKWRIQRFSIPFGLFWSFLAFFSLFWPLKAIKGPIWKNALWQKLNEKCLSC